jgi:hypothetical protein
MLYRLAFRITDDGYLRVVSSARGSREVYAIHLSDEIFAAAVNAADIAPFQTLRMLEAARHARHKPGMIICCDDVELTQEQIDVLCPRADRDLSRRIASLSF